MADTEQTVDTLVRLIEKEKLRRALLERQNKDADFQLLQDECYKHLTSREYSRMHRKDPLTYLKLDQNRIPNKIKHLENVTSKFEEIFGYHCHSLRTEVDGDLKHVSAVCSIEPGGFKFKLVIQQKQDENHTVKLVSASLLELTENVTLKGFLKRCKKSNDIPLLFHGLATYCKLRKARMDFLPKFDSDVWTIHADDTTGRLEFTINEADDKPFLKIIWCIEYNANIPNFAYGFITQHAEGSWLRKNHADTFHTILDSKQMTEALAEAWNTLFSVLSKKEKKGRKKGN